MPKHRLLIFVIALCSVVPAFAQGDVGYGGNWEPPVFDYQIFHFLKDGYIYTANVYSSKDIEVKPECFRPITRNYYIKIWSPDHYAIAKFKRCPTSKEFKHYSEILQADCEMYSRKKIVQDGDSQEKVWKLRLGHHSLMRNVNNSVSHIDSRLLTLDTRKLHHAARNIYLFADVSEDVKYDVPPSFPGGMDSLVSFVLQRIDYSVYNKADVVGTVLVEFTIEADGNISSPEIKVRLFPDCDENALQIVREMPRWQPATYKGKPVRCSFVLPVTFAM